MKQKKRCLFSDWQTQPHYTLSPVLFWDIDICEIDWQKMKYFIVRRVIEYGRMEDFYAAIKLYGGLDEFIEIIQHISFLSQRDIQFVKVFFHIKDKDLQCLKRKQLRENYLNT